MLLEILVKKEINKMGFPTKKEISDVLKKLENAEPSLCLPENASSADKLKYELCKKFVVYLRTENITQVKLAKILEVDPARVSEIVKYKINLFTIDKLLSLIEKLDIDLTVKVA